eukprot:COSAG05_NODE_18079_length_314_cov_0.725581_1_plen_33_part_01
MVFAPCVQQAGSPTAIKCIATNARPEKFPTGLT